jgi:uncharacterized membrane protein YqjE
VFKDSIKKFLRIDELIENVSGYVETRIDLVKYEIKEDLARGLSKAVLFLMFGLAIFLFSLFASLAIALKLSESLGYAGGFAIVSGFYLIVLIILFVLRQPIGVFLENQLMTILNKKK